MLEVSTTSNENSIDDETIADIESLDQTSEREYDFRESEKSDPKTLSHGSRSSKNSQQSYAQYLEYFTRYASTYAIYDRHGDILFYFTPKLMIKRPR